MHRTRPSCGLDGAIAADLDATASSISGTRSLRRCWPSIITRAFRSSSATGGDSDEPPRARVDLRLCVPTCPRVGLRLTGRDAGYSARRSGVRVGHVAYTGFVVESFVRRACRGREAGSARLSPRAGRPVARAASPSSILLAEKSGWATAPAGTGHGRGVSLRPRVSPAWWRGRGGDDGRGRHGARRRVVCVVDCGPWSIPIRSGRRVEGAVIFGSPRRCTARSRSRRVASSRPTSIATTSCASTGADGRGPYRAERGAPGRHR